MDARNNKRHNEDSDNDPCQDQCAKTQFDFGQPYWSFVNFTIYTNPNPSMPTTTEITKNTSALKKPPKP